jgi:hypothetical protein
MGKIIVGSFLILLGLGFFLEQTPLALIGLNMGTVWAIFWVVIGVVLLQKRKIFLGLLLTAFGLLSFIGGFVQINMGAWIFPLLVIALGVRILFKDDSKTMMDGEVIGTTSRGTTNQDYINESVVFGSLEKNYTSQSFKGGKIDCVFAGMKIDLRGIKPAKDAELEVNAIFGGGEILVSDDIRVEANGTGVFGGWTNKFSTADSSKPLLRVKGAAVFGGVEIKN